MNIIEQYFRIMDSCSEETMLSKIEKAGRTCYKSEDKITEHSAKEFVQRIIRNGHHSVLEHCHITVRFITDRGVSHELVRHRLASFSQESTRYCNYKDGLTFIRPWWVNPHISSKKINDCDLASCRWYSLMDHIEKEYLMIAQHTHAQEARDILPNCLKTEIVVTANIREWRHILELRTSKAAHPQMRLLMLEVLGAFTSWAPTLFEDIHPE